MSWSSFRRLLDLQLTLALKAYREANSSKESRISDHQEIQNKMTIKVICRLLDAVHWPVDTLDSHFTNSVNQFSRTSSEFTVQHIREFEQIQLDKEVEVVEEQVVEIDGKTGKEIDGQTGREIEAAAEEEILEDEEGQSEVEEVEEEAKAKHSEELLKKVYTHLHLSVRPKLTKLIDHKKPDAGSDGNEKTINIPLAAALINVLIRLGPECIRSYCPSVVLKMVDMLRSREFSPGFSILRSQYMYLNGPITIQIGLSQQILNTPCVL